MDEYLKKNAEKRVGGFEVLYEILINTDKMNIKKFEAPLIEIMKIYMTEKSDALRKGVFKVFTGLI